MVVDHYDLEVRRSLERPGKVVVMEMVFGTTVVAEDEGRNAKPTLVGKVEIVVHSRVSFAVVQQPPYALMAVVVGFAAVAEPVIPMHD